MANLKLGPPARRVDVQSKPEGAASAAGGSGVDAPSLPEGEASMVDAAGSDVKMLPDTETDQGVQGNHSWLVFGRSNKTQTFTLRDVPFKMEPITREIKQLVERLDKEEIIDLFSKFCDLPILPAVGFSRVIKAYTAIKAQKQHDVGSDVRERSMGTPRATHQCPECFTDWPIQWDINEPKVCICHKKVTPIKKTAHLTTMESKHDRRLLFVTGNGLTWVRTSAF